MCIEQFDIFEKNKNKDKIFHFIYQGVEKDKDKLQFSQNIFTDFKNESESSFETFNSLFSEHKENIINSVKRLKNYNYFKRTGSKRKLGYLFHGFPGCGKTSHVSAIANFDRRHILEVPLSRVKTNKELEEIINLTQINNVTFKKEELIIFFDEIDQVGRALHKRDNEQKENDSDKENNDELKDLLLKNIKSKSSTEDIQQNDQLNLGNILSRLDGIGNYNGLIIIAATNCIDKLSPALYRNGRLTALKFDFCRKEDIINLIEFYYQIKLTPDEIQHLPDRKHKISPATMKKYMEENEKNYIELLIKLKTKVI
jgi:ATP-dependent 26S proteasome regulatory subunit